MDGKEEECKAGDDRKFCRWATRCDMDEYKNLPNCKMTNPCQADPTLCLTICDHSSYKNTLKCQVQRCEIMPNEPICLKI